MRKRGGSVLKDLALFWKGVSLPLSFSLAIQPFLSFMLLRPPTLDLKKKKKKDSLSWDQHNLSLCTL